MDPTGPQADLAAVFSPARRDTEAMGAGEDWRTTRMYVHLHMSVHAKSTNKNGYMIGICAICNNVYVCVCIDVCVHVYV